MSITRLVPELPVAAVVFAHDGSLRAYNPSFARLLDLDAVEGRSFWELCQEGQRNRVVNELLQGREGFEIDFRAAAGSVSLRVVGGRAEEDAFLVCFAAAAGAHDASSTERVLRRQNAILLDLGKEPAIDAGDIETAYRKITEASAAGLGVARCSIWLYDAGETRIVCQDLHQIADGSHGLQGFTLTAADYPGYFVALAEDRTIAADDARRHPATREFTDGYLVPLGITSMLEAPIRRQGRLIGVLCHEHVGEPRSFSQEEQNFAANVADYVTRALEAHARRLADERLRDAHAALERHAEDLERKVVERTKAIQLVLDSTGDGLVTAALDGTLSQERSAPIAAWFGDYPPGTKAWSLFAPDDRRAADGFELGFGDLVDGFMPFEVIAEQLPKQVEREGRIHRFTYKGVGAGADGSPERVLVVVRDATAEVAAERAAREARELQTVAGHLLRDREGFVSFLDEADELARVLAPDAPLADTKRRLHTLKGNAGIFGLESVAEAAHAAEEVLAEEPTAVAQAIGLVAVAWREARGRIAAVLGDARGRRVALEDHEYERFLSDVTRRGVDDDLVAVVRSWRGALTRPLLERLGQQIQRVGERLGKVVDVEVADPGVRTARDDMGAFFSSLVHVVRNAIDHGIETPEERALAGKPERGRIALSVGRDGGALELVVEDDGRGIDWDAVRTKAERLAIPSVTPRDLEEAIFADGLSTRTEVTDLSGRGVGLGAVRQACRALGGELRVSSTRGAGTRFVFTLPDRPAVRVPGEAAAVEAAAAE